jgi:CBS domain-containing protein
MRFSECSVRARAHVAEAAAMMLQHRVHRLPVVDNRNVPIGIATRTDIFEPLISKQQDRLTNQEQRR